MNQPPLTVRAIVSAPQSKVWDYWTNPEHITQWAFTSDTWEAPAASNDLKVGGTFTTVMAAKDGSAKFDFSGTYTTVEPLSALAYVMADGRKVNVTFNQTDYGVEIIETFDPETENSLELQQAGWQAILDNFKKYVEQD